MSFAKAAIADEDSQPRPPLGETCTSCGAPIESLDRFCAACGDTAHGDVKRGEVDEAQVAPQRFFRCENCGSEVATDPDQRSYTCAFCDSSYVVEFSPDQSQRQRPEFVIGFAITPEQAQQMFRDWLAENRWFRPGDLSSVQIVDRLRGVYMPFWSFSMLAQSSWSADIGEYWYRTETYWATVNGKRVRRTRQVTETEWWELRGRHHQYFNGYLVSGSRGLPQTEAERIKPYQLEALKRYRPEYLAGWLAEEYSIVREAAMERCQDVFNAREENDVAAFMPGDRQSGLHVSTTFSHVQSDLILLPVYLLTYDYSGNQYRFLINGQTGKIAGDKPLSRLRVATAVAGGIGAVVLFILLWLVARAML